MAKSNIYISKIENCRTVSATGFRIKQAMYNALRACFAEKISFPYQGLLDSHCIPGTDAYLVDEQYYLLKENRFVPAERTASEREIAFREIAAQLGGNVVFTPEREPLIMVGGWLLRGGPVTENSKYSESFPEDFSVPYPLYPRTINISTDGRRKLVETEPEKCDWLPIDD